MVEIWSQLRDWTAQLKSKKDISENSLLTEYALIYSISLVNINEAFWTRLLEVYETESQWNCIKTMILNNDTLRENTAKILYCLIWKLIYFNDFEQGLCLCILTDLIKKVFY